MSKLIVTDHALERFEQRVSSKDNFRPNFREIVVDWCEKAIAHSRYIGADTHGAHLYRYSDYILVLDDKKRRVITIKPKDYSVGQAKEVEDTLKQTIKKTIMRMLRPMFERQQTLLIEIHTLELRKIRVHNPQTKQSIGERIDGLYAQLDAVKREINVHSSLAYKHGVKIDE